MESLESKLLLDRIEKLEKELADKSTKLTWATAAPQGPLTEIKGRCVLCGRTATIMTDDPSKGTGFRHVCKCQNKQEELGGDVTTWHARMDIQPPDDDDEPVAPKAAPEPAANRVPAGGSKIAPSGGVSA